MPIRVRSSINTRACLVFEFKERQALCRFILVRILHATNVQFVANASTDPAPEFGPQSFRKDRNIFRCTFGGTTRFSRTTFHKRSSFRPQELDTWMPVMLGQRVDFQNRLGFDGVEIIITGQPAGIGLEYFHGSGRSGGTGRIRRGTDAGPIPSHR